MDCRAGSIVKETFPVSHPHSSKDHVGVVVKVGEEHALWGCGVLVRWDTHIIGRSVTQWHHKTWLKVISQ